MHLTPFTGPELESMLAFEGGKDQISGIDESNPHIGSAETMISPERSGKLPLS